MEQIALTRQLVGSLAGFLGEGFASTGDRQVNLQLLLDDLRQGLPDLNLVPAHWGRGGVVRIIEQGRKWSEFVEGSAVMEQLDREVGWLASAADVLEARGSLPGDADTGPDCQHCPEFTWIIWYGERFDFSKGNRANLIKCLWHAWEAGGRDQPCGVTTETLAEAVYGPSVRAIEVRKVLQVGGKPHPAWQTAIKSLSKGVYALVPPGWTPGP